MHRNRMYGTSGRHKLRPECSGPQHSEHLEPHICQEKKKNRCCLIFQTYMCHHLQLQKPKLAVWVAPDFLWATARRAYYHPLKSHWQSMSQSPRLVMHLSAQLPPYTNYALTMSIFQLVWKLSCALQTTNVNTYTFCSLLVPHKHITLPLHSSSTCLTCTSPDWPISRSDHLPQTTEN